MTKTIDTLIEDIHELFTGPHEFDETNVQEFGQRLATHIKNRINEDRGKPSLRMSNLGSTCDRELWYKINKPELAEKLPANVRFKFLYGDILEELILFLAKEAGHTVEGTQDTLEINGVKGHRDAVIDGYLVDTKSASTYAFQKFRDHLTPDKDEFGYIDQLGAYLAASQSDPLVKEKDVAAFFAVDKTLGHMTLDMHAKSDKDYSKLVDEKRAMLASSTPPKRSYEDEEDGKSGNRKLGTKCSYCAFKEVCWPGVKRYDYSGKPRWLTKVAREPVLRKNGTQQKEEVGETYGKDQF